MNNFEPNLIVVFFADLNDNEKHNKKVLDQ